MRNIVLSLAAHAARVLPEGFKSSLYKSPSVSKILRRGLNQAAPEGFTETTIAAGDLAGARMILDLKTEKDYWLGTYEPHLQQAIQDLVLPGQIAYDIGANTGYVSLLLAQRVGKRGHVYSFEALPANLQRLKWNIQINDLGERVTIIPAAVKDRSGVTDFYLGPSPGTGKLVGSAGRSTIQYRESIEVEGVSIDEFIFQSGNPGPDILKIDIEGGEIFALPGMIRTLDEVRPLLFIELHGFEAAQANWELLTGQNYQICRMATDYLPIHIMEEKDWKSYWVAFPHGR